jgi:osmotically-inducible protein OsmY
MRAARALAEIATGLALVGVLSGCATVAGGDRSDARLAGDVRGRLAAAGLKNVAAWDIDARHGNVYIVGTAGSQMEQMRAESIVRGTPGVQRAYTMLLVGPYVWTEPQA